MFEEIIGQAFPKKVLQNAFLENKISHAYIFHGKNGIGKMTLAKKFSQYIICENKSACMSCTSCKQFLAETVDDFKIIDVPFDKTEILVDQIREVVNDVVIKPYIFPKKIYIINNADKMNIKAQNAFLKVLEEPPKYALFILISESNEKILPTIKSRCVDIRFSDLKASEIKTIIKNNYNIEPDDYVLGISDGSVSLAYSILLNHDSLAVRENAIKLFISFLKTKSQKDMLCLYKLLFENKNEILTLLKMFNSVLLDIINSKEPDLIKIIPSDISLSSDKVYSIFEILQELSVRLNSNAGLNLIILDALSKIKKVLV